MLSIAGLLSCVIGGSGAQRPEPTGGAVPLPSASGADTGSPISTSDYCEDASVAPEWTADADPCATLEDHVFGADCARLGFSGGHWLLAWWGTYEGGATGGSYECRDDAGLAKITRCVPGNYGHYPADSYEMTFDPAMAQVDEYALVGTDLTARFADYFPYLADDYGSFDGLFSDDTTGCP